MVTQNSHYFNLALDTSSHFGPIFLSLNCCWDMSFCFYFPVFSLMLTIRYSKLIEILLFSVSFCPPKSIIMDRIPNPRSIVWTRPQYSCVSSVTSQTWRSDMLKLCTGRWSDKIKISSDITNCSCGQTGWWFPLEWQQPHTRSLFSP